MTATMAQLGDAFDDHGSLAASLEDFEAQERRSPLFDIPSQHSGFRSEQSESEADDRSSGNVPWSPPGFKQRKKISNTGTWFRHDPYAKYHAMRPSHSPSVSRQTSPEYQDAREEDPDITLAVNVPLPIGNDSPLKGRSPEPDERPEDIMRAFDAPDGPENTNNYIRFAVRAEVQHREPFVPFINFCRSKFDTMTKTKTSSILSLIIALLSLSTMRIVLMPPAAPPVPDLVKLSTLARSFEPLIFYSEHGHGQIVALQETSVAVWDLGESVRGANLTSGPQIVNSLDELSDSLKMLSIELTRFFADVDADVDSILLVMDWAKRELSGTNSPGKASISAAIFDHVHGLLNRGGLLESTNGPTSLGQILTEVFGVTSPQKTRGMLTRTFYEFLNVLEEAINNELSHSTALFLLFESIDRQFQNLQRSVVREEDSQDKQEGEVLDRLWTRLVGGNSGLLRKFEKNKKLLSDLKSRTLINKQMIVQHHGRLQTLKVNLETLRRRLVSPLVRRNDSVSIDNESAIEQQIRGLEGTYSYLKDVRDKQKSKLMEMVYGAGSGKSRVISTSQPVGIESR